MTGETRNRAKAGITSPAAPRITSASLTPSFWISIAIGRPKPKASCVSARYANHQRRCCANNVLGMVPGRFSAAATRRRPR